MIQFLHADPTVCHPAAWAFVKAEYLRPEAPSISDCYRRMEAVSEKNGWQPVPTYKTICKWLGAHARGDLLAADNGLANADIPIEATFQPAAAHPERAWHCVVDALDAAFPHLNWTQIDTPPSGMFDATLVRQIGLYIFCVKLGVPKLRAMSAARMTKDIKWRGLKRIHRRMKTLAFRRHVDAITEDAKTRIEEMLAR